MSLDEASLHPGEWRYSRWSEAYGKARGEVTGMSHELILLNSHLEKVILPACRVAFQGNRCFVLFAPDGIQRAPCLRIDRVLAIKSEVDRPSSNNEIIESAQRRTHERMRPRLCIRKQRNQPDWQPVKERPGVQKKKHTAAPSIFLPALAQSENSYLTWLDLVLKTLKDT
jgi:hypothetical protein